MILFRIEVQDFCINYTGDIPSVGLMYPTFTLGDSGLSSGVCVMPACTD